MPIIRESDCEVAESRGDPASVTGDYRVVYLARAGGLTQFGANLETLQPGARSSVCHWHEAEDEFVYLLSGELTLHEDGSAAPLRPGEAACFKAGTPAGHYLENTGTAEATYLVVGTRAERDRITYPDDDRVLARDRTAGSTDWTTIAGEPADNPYASG